MTVSETTKTFMLKLPIDSYLEKISEKLEASGSLVLSAETGSGKSTRVPWYLAKQFGGNTLVLQPRRIAAQMLAERVANENSLTLGKEVGYHIRYDRKFTDQSKLVFITEALLKKYIQSDPFLEKTDLVVLDEFHERSIHSDIALMLLKKIKVELRPDLKILVMSASMDSGRVSEYLDGAPIFEAEGRVFPVEVHFSKSKIEDPKSLIQLTNSLLAVFPEALKSCPKKDILVFLPGKREIEACHLELSKNFRGLNLYPLYASLGAEGIRNALSPASHQKIILATNIAETSLTLPNLGAVIDSGLVREASISHPHLIPKLRTIRISQASAKQRLGRAGRVQEGHCFRLWASHDQNFLREYDTPEILRSDLTEEIPFLLDSVLSGDPEKFPWFEPPPQAHIRASLRKLTSLGIMDEKFRLNPNSKKALNSPLSLRTALFLEATIDLNDGIDEASALWAAALEELSSAGRLGDFEAIVNANRSALQNSRTFRRTNEFYKKHILSSKSSPAIVREEALCRAFVDRVCKFRKSSSEQISSNKMELLMNGGRGVKLLSGMGHSHLQEYLVAIDLKDSEGDSSDSLVTCYLSIKKDDLLKFFSKEIRIKKWAEETPKGLRFWEAKSLQDLPLEIARPSSVDQAELRSVVFRAAISNWNSFVELDSALSQFWIRFSRYHDEMGQGLPAPSLELLESIQTKFRNTAELAASKELQGLLLSGLSFSEKKNFERLFPKELVLSNGRVKALRYSQDGSVGISVRLQDAFAWKQHPSINNGKIPLRVELLSPANRPIQVTEDLLGFWRGSYAEVRKEMRARYPKHKWPENPFE